MRYLSKSTRNRLLKVAGRLDGWSAWIKRYVSAKTPRRGPRGPKVAA